MLEGRPTREEFLPQIRQCDDVLEALDDLVNVLQDSNRRNQLAMRRARAIRRSRIQDRTYREIFAGNERSLIQEITRQNLDNLLRASARLRRAEASALHAEGMTMEEIAVLFGVTRQRVSVLLREAGQRNGAL